MAVAANLLYGDALALDVGSGTAADYSLLVQWCDAVPIVPTSTLARTSSRDCLPCFQHVAQLAVPGEGGRALSLHLHPLHRLNLQPLRLALWHLVC